MADLYYYESGYIDDSYFVYTADAESALSSTVTIDATAGKLQQAVVQCDSLFTPTLDVSATRNSFAVLDSTASINVTGTLTTNRTVNLEFTATQTTNNERVRNNSSTLEVIADCEGFATIGVTHQGHAHLQSEFAQSGTSGAIRDFEIDFYITSVMTPDGVERLRDNTINSSSSFSQQTDAGRIQQAVIICESLFEPTMSVGVVKNTFAVLDSTSALATDATANRSADIALSSIINLSSQGDKFVGYASDIASQFQFDVTAVKLNGGTVTAQTNFTQTSNVRRIIRLTTTSFTRTSHPITVFGNTKYITGASTSKFGNSSIFFDGTGDYLQTDTHTDFALTGDFTVEFWIYRTSANIQDLVDFRTSSNGTEITLEISGSGNFRILTSNSTRLTHQTPVTSNVLTHLAVTRVGGVIRLFVNGVVSSSTYTNTTAYTSATRVTIGDRGYAPGTNDYAGFIDDLRISKGIGRYTTTYALPTTPAVNDQYTVLMLRGDGPNNSQFIVDEPTVIYNTQNISGAFTVGAQPNKIKDATTTIISTATTDIVANKIIDISKQLDVVTTVDALVGTIKEFVVDEVSLFSPTIDVNAITNTFAVLDSVASMSIDAIKQTKVSSSLTTTFTQNAVGLRIKDLGNLYNGYTVQGVEFTPASLTHTTLGEPWIAIRDQYSSPSPKDTRTYLISFWAKNPKGPLLQTEIDDYYLDYTPDAGIVFKDGNLEYTGWYFNNYSFAIEHSVITYPTDSLTNSWDHYLIYNNQFEQPKLYKNGNLITHTSRSGLATGFALPLFYGGLSAGRGPVLTWSLGIQAEAYENPNGLSIVKQGADPYSGSIGQVAVWTNTNTSAPNGDLLSVRNKLFNDGFVSLGTNGTGSGLVQPELYVPLENYTSLPVSGEFITAITAKWVNTTGTTFVPEYGNSTYYTVSNYTPTAGMASTPPKNLLVRSSLSVTGSTSNSGFYNLYSNFAFNVVTTKAYQLASNINSEFTVDVIVDKIYGNQAQLDVNASLTADNNFIFGAVSNQTAQASLVAVNNRYLGYTANVSVVASQTTNNFRVRTDSATAQISSSLTCDLGIVKLASADLQVEGFVQEVTSKIGGLLVTMESSFDLVADPIASANIRAVLDVTATQDTTVVKTARTSKELTAVVSSTINIKRLRDNAEELEAQFTQSTTTDNSKIVGVTANLSAQFTQETDTNNSKRVYAIVNSQAEFTQQQNVVNYKNYTVSTQATITQLTTAVKTVDPVLLFESISIELVSGQALSYDRNLTIKIKRETKNLLVLTEPRTIEIVREYRALQILEENTILPVHSETRVNMVRTQL